MAVAIDFEAYTALLMSSLERFSIPSLGSFVWHIDRAEGDPRTATLKPPKPILKYEPGQRYLAETVAFLRDHYGISEEEAKQLLEEVGRLLLGYLKSSPEINIWKLGKLRKIGVTYKFEVSEEAPLSFLEDLAPVSLRATEERVVSLGPTPTSQATPPKQKEEKPKKEKKAPPAEKTRARQIEESFSPQPKPHSGSRSLVLVGLLLLVLIGAGMAAYLILKQRKKTTKPPVEIVLRSEKTPKAPADSASPSHSPTKPTPSSESQSTSSASKEETPKRSSIREIREKGVVQTQKESALAGQSSKQTSTTPPKETPSSLGPSTLLTPQPGRYYLIVGAYPSLEEAKAKAQAFAGESIEFLPHPKKSGWVRISLYSSTNKQAVEAKRSQILARVPDAWIFTP